MMDRRPLVIWTIYNRPTDFPDCFVARKFECRAGAREAVPTSDVIRALALDDIRWWMLDQGLACITRAPTDPPQVVESWL
jgi:hypothetical protein